MPSRKDEHPRGPNKRQRKIIDDLTWKGKTVNKPLLAVQDASPSPRSLFAHASPRALDALPKDHIRCAMKPIRRSKQRKSQRCSLEMPDTRKHTLMASLLFVSVCL